MALQQASPSQPGTKAVRAKKVFVAKRGIFSDAHAFGIELGTRENPGAETHDLHLASECSFEMRYQVGMHTMSPHQKRRTSLQEDDEHYDSQRWFPPLLKLDHLARKFRRVIKKRVGAAPHSGQDESVSDDCTRIGLNFNALYGACGSIWCALAGGRAFQRHQPAWTKMCSRYCSHCSSLPPTNRSGTAYP